MIELLLHPEIYGFESKVSFSLIKIYFGEHYPRPKAKGGKDFKFTTK